MTAIGDRAPTFALPDTEGATHEPGGAPATVVVFTCNHCPYALAWHERIVELARDYADRGVRVLAINQNDAERYPRDSLQAMRARVQRGEFGGVPYLYDSCRTSLGLMTRRRHRMCSCSTPAVCCAIAAPRMPTATIRRRTPRTCATPSTPCSPAATPIARRRRRWGARSSGRADQRTNTSARASRPRRPARLPRLVCSRCSCSTSPTTSSCSG
jgi:AhpC/TSA family